MSIMQKLGIFILNIAVLAAKNEKIGDIKVIFKIFFQSLILEFQEQRLVLKKRSINFQLFR